MDSVPEGAALFITMEGGQEQKKTNQQEWHSSALYLLSNTQYKTNFFQNKAECEGQAVYPLLSFFRLFMYF